MDRPVPFLRAAFTTLASFLRFDKRRERKGGGVPVALRGPHGHDSSGRMFYQWTAERRREWRARHAR